MKFLLILLLVLFSSCTNHGIHQVGQELEQKEVETDYQERLGLDSVLVYRVSKSDLFTLWQSRLDSVADVNLAVWMPSAGSNYGDSLYHIQIAASSPDRMEGLENFYFSKTSGRAYHMDVVTDSLVFVPGL